MRTTLFVIPLALVLFGQGCVISGTPTLPKAPPIPRSPTTSTLPTKEVAQPIVAAAGLDVPWDFAFLPAGDMLVTERGAGLTGVAHDGTKIAITNGPPVKAYGESGLMGLLLDPAFATNRQLYLYVTATVNGKNINRVERYVLSGDMLTDRKVMLDDIPAAVYHDGGRMAWGPDGKLYITTGDATNERLAQDTKSLAGKILRLNADGSIPSDNPFGNAVWSYGHRNPQGLTWDNEGRLWATEHGRSGITTGYDELNLIEKGKNYGWPTIQGPEKKAGMETPKLQSGPNATWAPASGLYWDGSIFFGGLRGEALYEADITKTPPVLKEHFKGTYGRIRTVQLGPDGMFYFTTSNRDGRGTPKADDDKIIKVDPSIFRD